jgi:oligopeptidase B
VYAYDLETRERTLLKRQEVLGGYDPERYRVERLTATAPDGTPVAISLAARRDVPRDGTAPLHLVGYGSYGHPLPVLFSSNRLSLLDRGVVCALAHVRGGGELGKPWHDAGRMANKTNSFSDLIASADHLVSEGYASRDRIVLEGGSAGGLLIGAALNLRPDVARGAILKVPFVDVLNTMLDASLPLTVGEFEEWGNPTLPEDYRRIRAYCPYTNLARRPYPALLVNTTARSCTGKPRSTWPACAPSTTARPRRSSRSTSPRVTAAPRVATMRCARWRGTWRGSSTR